MRWSMAVALVERLDSQPGTVSRGAVSETNERLKYAA